MKLEALADFAAGAGHEMNNPLAVIAGRAQLLLADETHPQRRASLALIWAQAQRVHEMIADVMLFARPPAPQFEQADLRELLRRSLREAVRELPDRMIVLDSDSSEPAEAQQCERMSTASKVAQTPDDCAQPIRLAARIPDRAVVAQVDPDQIGVVVRVLVRNALEAVVPGGTVLVTLHAEADRFIVEVDDDGPGITEEERPHIFNPFYSGRQAGRGLGTGLSKAWRLVGLHGGTIEVARSSLGGACFRVAIAYQPCSLDGG